MGHIYIVISYTCTCPTNTSQTSASLCKNKNPLFHGFFSTPNVGVHTLCAFTEKHRHSQVDRTASMCCNWNESSQALL